MKIKRIVQKDDTGCGIACVAMLSGRPYAEVKQIFVEQIFTSPRQYFGTYHREVEQALHILGFNTKRRRFRGWRKIQSCAIVAIERRKNKTDWHWVVFVCRGKEAFAIDPMPGYNKYIRDFRLIRGSGIYIEIDAVEFDFLIANVNC